MEKVKKYLEVTDESFSREVLSSDVPVLVDFSAEWCGPCRMMEPVLENLAGAFEGKAKIVKLDVDANPQTTVKFGVRNLPTMLFFKGGQVVDRQVGATSGLVLSKKISDQL